MKKTIVATVLLWSLVVCLLLPTAYANGFTTSVSASSPSARVGENIAFTVRISGAAATTSGSIALNYNSSKFEYVSSAWKKTGATISTFDQVHNKGAIAFPSATDLNGDYFTFILRVKAAGASAQSVSVSVKLTGIGTSDGSAIATATAALFNDISAYRNPKSAPNAPEGSVFAGWYEDEGLTTPIAEEVVSGSAYAKFVDAGMLNTHFQLLAGTTGESQTTKLRTLTTVDCLGYKKIQFTVSYNAKVVTVDMKTVYTTITATDGGNTITYHPDDKKSESEYYWSVASRYIAGHSFVIKNSNFDTEYTFTSKWVTMDGTTVSGSPQTVTVNSLIG